MAEEHPRVRSVISTGETDSGSHIKEGWLFKQGGHYKSWKRRYFVMKPDALLYYRSNHKIKESSPLGRIGLATILDIEKSVGKGKKKDNYFKINISGPRGYYLIEAESPQVVEEWIDAVKKATMMGGRLASKIESSTDSAGSAGHGGGAGGHAETKLEVLNLTLKVADTSQKSLEPSNRVDFLVDAMDALETEENEERAIQMKKRGMTLAPMLITDDDGEEDTKSVNPQDLYTAVANSNFSAANALIGLGADSNWKNSAEADRTCLHVAAATGDAQLFELILQQTKWKDSTDRHGWSPLHIASFYGHCDIIKLWFKHKDISYLFAEDKEKRTPLYLAAVGGHQECASVIIEKHMEQGRTPVLELLTAALSGDANKVESLVQSGTAVDSLGECNLQAIHLCSATGNTGCIRKIVELGGKISCTDATSKTPLHHAACRGDIEAIKILLDGGAKIDAIDNRLKTPLHLAAGQGHASCVGLLIEKGANIHAVDESNFTPLHLASIHGQTECVKLLIEKSANVNNTAVERISPVLLAAHGGHSDCIKLLHEKGADINLSMDGGRTPIHEAVLQDCREAMKTLISLGANIDLADWDGNTALHIAAMHNRLEVASYLLEIGAKVDRQNQEGTTAMRIAILNAKPELLTLLLEAGADINITLNGTSFLHEAAENGFQFGVRMLIERGARVDSIDRNNWTPLIKAASNNHMNTVQFLLDKEAKVDHKAVNGWTPIHAASCLNRTEILRLLLDKGASVMTKDDDGLTPLHHAAVNGSKECIILLLERGADIHAKDNHKHTPVQKAAMNNQVSCTMLLIAHGAVIDDASQEAIKILMRSIAGDSFVDLQTEVTRLNDKVKEMSLENEKLQKELSTANATVAAAQKRKKDKASRKSKREIKKDELGLEGSIPPNEQPKLPVLASAPSLQAGLNTIKSFLSNPLAATVSSSTAAAASSTSAASTSAATATAAVSSSPPTSPASSAPATTTSAAPKEEKSGSAVKDDETNQASAKSYIQQAQAVLSKEEYKNFQSLLKDYKTRKITIDVLIQQIKEMFSGPKKSVLRAGFVAFIPPKFRQKYKDELTLENEAAAAAAAAAAAPSQPVATSPRPAEGAPTTSTAAPASPIPAITTTSAEDQTTVHVD